MLRPYPGNPGSGTQNECQRHRNSIGGVGGLRRVLEMQQASHHRRHLRLLRAAGSDHGLLDHGRCILGDIELRLLRCQQNDSSGMPKDECRTDVLMIESILEGEYRGLVAFDELSDCLVQLGETLGKGIVASEAKNAAFDESAQPMDSVPVY